jgi:hypothetical protein
MVLIVHAGSDAAGAKAIAVLHGQVRRSGAKRVVDQAEKGGAVRWDWGGGTAPGLGCRGNIRAR